MFFMYVEKPTVLRRSAPNLGKSNCGCAAVLILPLLQNVSFRFGLMTHIPITVLPITARFAVHRTTFRIFIDSYVVRVFVPRFMLTKQSRSIEFQNIHAAEAVLCMVLTCRLVPRT